MKTTPRRYRVRIWDEGEVEYWPAASTSPASCNALVKVGLVYTKLRLNYPGLQLVVF